MIRDTWTIAASRPASTAWLRKTELSATRASGSIPKLTFETPRMVRTPGSSRLILRIASSVSIPARRVSSWPVTIGNVSASKTRS